MTMLFLFLLALTGCPRPDSGRSSGETVIVFKHGRIAGDPAPLRELLSRFEEENPGIRVKDETLPASSDEQHQFFVINLEGRSADFDVLSMDSIWTIEFARAGWLADLSRLLPAAEQGDFFPGPLAAATWQGRLYGLPWYVDAGILYYRRDLLEKYGLSPPRTWPELVETARRVTSTEKDLYGFVWQGKQYEGLVCNALEFLRSNNGDVLRDGKVVIDSPANAVALGFMHDLISSYGVSPPLVTTSMEEQTRHIFGNGRALFMRNWPYARHLLEREGSALRGTVGIAPLPSFPGGESTPTLGGWNLGVNRHSRHPEASLRLAGFLASPAAQKRLALTIGYQPARRSLYEDRELREKQPFIVSLRDIFMQARPRPVTPFYPMMTQVLQPEFSAALAGIKSPEAALRSAARQIGHIAGGIDEKR